jgi:hypothetical protein
MDIRDKAIITLLAKDRHKAKRAYQSWCIRCGFCRAEDQAQAHSEADQPGRYSLMMKRPLSFGDGPENEGSGVNRLKETALFLSTWSFRISRNYVYL